MSRLRVARAEPAALGIHLFELRDPGGATLPPFAAGAHLEVTSPNGSKRKYSLCNDESERDRYVIAVKRDPGGRGGSVDLVDNTRMGDLIEVSEPRNAFTLEPRAPGYLFLAGGIGVTPIMAMVRSAAAAAKPFHLFYCTRSPETTAFRDELLAAEYAGKVKIHHDGGDPARTLDLWPLFERPTREHIYCCGPRPMLEAVRDMTGHWPASAVHFESFLDAGAAARPEDRPFDVVLAHSGTRLKVAAGSSILQAMRDAGFEAASSCESGTCGTCRTRLLEGTADHRDLVLAEEERGHQVMICVSRAITPTLVIDR
ncbi:MAG TPA: PDR/VanB family oxidoreductase [Usitatibacter sp.]|nr:PDR/VanB family oxidoreductase [Usitatibacter sp.]